MKVIGKAALNAGKMFLALQNTILKTVWLGSILKSGVIPGNSCACWDVAARHKLAPARVLQCAVQEGCELVWGERSSTRKCWHFQEISRDMSCLWSECQYLENNNPADQAKEKRLFSLWQWGLSHSAEIWNIFVWFTCIYDAWTVTIYCCHYPLGRYVAELQNRNNLDT